MTRIYLDSNIYRYLKNNDPGKYASLLATLINIKNQLIFYYSYAHLSDLGRDKTDKKFEDLIFMEQLVDKNFLNLHSDEEIVNVQIASPKEAFNSMNFAPLSEALDFEQLAAEMEIHEDDTPEIKAMKKLTQSIFNMPLSALGIGNFLTDLEEDSPLARMLPSLDKDATLLDLTKGMLSTFDNMNEDPSVWREFRNYSLQALDSKKFDIDINDSNFNELLKDTLLQKTFLEFVEETFTHNKSLEKQREYNFFITAYQSLNLLGLDNEKNKKVVFSSFQNDAQHAYYAAHCDYLVSADEQLILKAKVLYKLFDIQTKALTLEEFEQEVSKINTAVITIDSFAQSLADLFKDAELVNDFEVKKENKRVLAYQLQERLFGYFNRLNLVIENGDSPMYIFFNSIKNYSRFTSFIEFEKIINKITQALGNDSKSNGSFTELDKTQIIDNTWKGRIWYFQEETFCLELEPSENALCFYYIPQFKITL